MIDEAPEAHEPQNFMISTQSLLELIGELVVAERCVCMAMYAALDRSSDAELRRWLRQEYEITSSWIERTEAIESELGSRLSAASPLAELELIRMEEDLERRTPPKVQQIWDLENVVRSCSLVCERLDLLSRVIPFVDDPDSRHLLTGLLSELQSRSRKRLKTSQRALCQMRLQQMTIPQDRSLAA